MGVRVGAGEGEGEEAPAMGEGVPEGRIASAVGLAVQAEAEGSS